VLIDNFPLLHGFVFQDTTIILSLWCLLHDKEHWGDPEAFRPERFLDEYGNFVKDEWMIPFGTGKRICLGEVMAKAVLFIFYSTLLQEFSFSLPDGDPQPSTLSVSGITTSPQTFRVKITKRC
jgi:methyl farnesoate epoxidase/farnesoate epoxidase